MLYTHTEHQTRFENVVCQKSVLEICLDPFPVTLDPLFSPFNLFNTDFNISSQILNFWISKLTRRQNFAKENWPKIWPYSTRSILNWIIQMTWCWISYKMTSWWRHNFHTSDALSKIVHCLVERKSHFYVTNNYSYIYKKGLNLNCQGAVLEFSTPIRFWPFWLTQNKKDFETKLVV